MDKARLNWSTLKYLHTSPKLLAWRIEHPQKDTPDLRLGRAIHCAILEPAEFGKRWVVAGQCAATTKAGSQCGSAGSLYNGQWFCRVKGHAPADAKVPEAFEILEPEDSEIVSLCSEAVASHEVAKRTLSGGHSEVKMEWTDQTTGIECRGTVDYITPSNLVDLKSTRRGTIREFTRDCAANLYNGQLAWYLDGAIACGRLPADAPLPFIVTVSTIEPYDVVAYQLSRATLEAGRILYRDLLSKYVQCRAAGWWPGIGPDLQILELPNWAPGMQGSEQEGSW